MKSVLLFLVLVFTSFSVPALATEQSEAKVQHESTYKKRLELARQMHEIRPARVQVEEAVSMAALKLPPLDRADFQKEILSAFDFEKLEALSTKAMAEIFTVEELAAMVSYFGSTEAQSIAGKMPVYEDMMQPEIMKMLDSALMKLRTGN